MCHEHARRTRRVGLSAKQPFGSEHFSASTRSMCRWANTQQPGGSELTKKSKIIIRRKAAGIPIACQRCQETVGYFTGEQVGSNELPSGAVTSIVVKPSWSAHLCVGSEGRKPGDVCPGCGGVCDDPEPEDPDHPYWSCAECAGGA